MSLSSVYAEFDLFCVIIMVMITFKTISLSKHLKYQWIYLVMMGFAMTLVASDMLYEFSDAGVMKFSENIVYLLNIIYFISSLFIAFFWFIYTYCISGFSHTKRNVIWIAFLMPVFLLSVAAFFTKSTRWVFYFDEEGYHRGTINIVYMVVPLIYFLSSCVVALINYLKNRNRKNGYTIKTVFSFAFFPIAAVAIQAFFVGFPAVCIGAMLGMLQVFMISIADERDELLVAETISKAKNDFFTKISHEIRTPINAILGMNTMIIRESKEKQVRE